MRGCSRRLLGLVKVMSMTMSLGWLHNVMAHARHVYTGLYLAIILLIHLLANRGGDVHDNDNDIVIVHCENGIVRHAMTLSVMVLAH